ncbi:MAG TPA: hypothetical protein VKQ30_01185 [Ktedonobacterales bacterium]|nr:hypothetical protein [Ktedonobacterales bacterium]
MAGLPPTITDATVTLTFGAAGQYYGYCTIRDVDYEFANIANYKDLWPQPGAGSSVMANGNSIVAQEITNAGVEMQQMLARIYQMPYTGADGGILHTLRQINAKLATANLIDRYMQANEPDLSPAAAERRSWAELMLTDIVDGVIQWATPFGDAVPLAEKPIYPLAAGATVLPDPTSSDPFAATAVFTMGRTRVRRGGVM